MSVSVLTITVCQSKRQLSLNPLLLQHSTSMERRKKRRGMKKRERKKRESKNGREEPHHPVADPSLEPNLPCPVMKMEAKKSRMPPYGAAPWLVFSHGKRERTKTFFNVSEGSYYVRNIPEMRRSDCLASCYGWLVMLNKTSGDLFLLNSVSLQKIQLPCLSESYSFNLCVLSSPKTMALRYLNSQKKLNLRHAKWVQVIQEYTFVLKHKVGIENKLVSALSHRVPLLHSMSIKVTGFEHLKKDYSSYPDFKGVCVVRWSV
ncbi:uncharacterized protein LOC131226890 [Magnolia sinica]|uniref:uncharacterized protein LOC131226890 n=1 Tax=Magnolia sinica TaxID=86752 RepID=UPI00265B709D|nr:uncharacterized protein LOC131226890 [Magnolia sinica]